MEATIAAIAPASDVERLYRLDGDRLWRALFTFSQDTDIASDAVAEAFAQLLRRGDAVRDPQAWVWRAGFRIAAGALKERRSAPLAAQPDANRPDRYVDQDLLDALARLPDGQRASLVLFYYGDLPVGEIAARHCGWSDR